MRLPNRLAANTYLVLGIAALIFTSRPLLSTYGRYFVGIVVEIALAALALVFVRLERLPVRETVRLRRPEMRMYWLALAAVPGLWIVGVVLNLLSTLILGYTPAVTPDQYPTDALGAFLLAVTTVVIAPVCEELIFRGYVQRAYEVHHRWIGVAVGAAIFAAYHLRFQGLLGLMPVSLGLGLISLRTDSVYPSMVTHAGFNAIATLLLVGTSFLPMRAVAALTALLICGGALLLPLSLGALWLLWNTTRSAAVTTGAPMPHRMPKWAWIVPAVVLMGSYSYAAASEVLTNRYPEVVLRDELALIADETWSQPVAWHYRVQDRLGRGRGHATCTRTGVEPSHEIVLDCSASHAGFDLTEGIPGLAAAPDGSLPRWLPGLSTKLGIWLEVEAASWTLSTTWAEPTLRLMAVVAHEEQDGLQYRLEYAKSGSTSVLSYGRTGEPQTVIDSLPQDSLMSREWAWRVSGLDFQLPYGSQVTLIRADGQESVSIIQGFMHVVGGEPLWTPAGNYVTWRVDLSWSDAAGHRSTESAWYDAQEPHTLVRYDDGSVSYVLTQVEEIGRQAVEQTHDLLR